MQDSHQVFIVFIVLKHGLICIFMIHSGSAQKMLTASFELVWDSQKSAWTIFLSTKTRCFLILKIFGEDKRSTTLNALPYCFSSHF